MWTQRFNDGLVIKVLHDHLTEDQQARDRLHREAVAVAKLQHKNIIEVFDFSTGTEGPAYIVMEYVEGQSLADILKSLSFESCPEQGLHFLRRIVSALEHAHENGVIHRDLKPENVLLSEDGHLKLMDFGIARLVDGNAMTLTGTLLGSPGYMAPEYIEAKPTDHRVDIFAFQHSLSKSDRKKSLRRRKPGIGSLKDHQRRMAAAERAESRNSSAHCRTHCQMSC